MISVKDGGKTGVGFEIKITNQAMLSGNNRINRDSLILGNMRSANVKLPSIRHRKVDIVMGTSIGIPTGIGGQSMNIPVQSSASIGGVQAKNRRGINFMN